MITLPPAHPPPGSAAQSSASVAAQPARWTTDALVRLGEEGLREHLRERAVWAHQKYGRLTAARVAEFLLDPACLRYPTRLVYAYGEMATHQFAQPSPDPDNPAQRGVILHVRPALRRRPDLVPLAVAYLVPLINYGEIVADAHCLFYGATLLGMLETEYYSELCALADVAGAASRYA